MEAPPTNRAGFWGSTRVSVEERTLLVGSRGGQAIRTQAVVVGLSREPLTLSVTLGARCDLFYAPWLCGFIIDSTRREGER